MKINRVILIVLDSVGIGALPDAHLYNDEGSNTLGNIAKFYPNLQIPNLVRMGLGNIDPTNLLPKTDQPLAAFGKSNGTICRKRYDHRALGNMWNRLEKPFPTFPKWISERIDGSF